MLHILSHTPEFNANMAGLPEGLRNSITEFMNGKSLAEVSKGFRQPLVAGVPGVEGSVVTCVKIDGKDFEVKEGDGSAVKVPPPLCPQSAAELTIPPLGHQYPLQQLGLNHPQLPHVHLLPHHPCWPLGNDSRSR
jgi:hypothetical protein